MTTLEVLRAARALVDTPEKWTQGVYATDSDGNTVPPEDDDAVCFCLSGALWHADPDGPWGAYEAVGVAVRRNVIAFNDDEATTHADVLAGLDRAIAEAA